MVRGPKRPKDRPHGQKQGVAQHRNKSPGGSSPYILDRLLVPRVLNHGKHNSLTDVDTVAAALRQTHKEYQRRPQAAFRQMVAKAIQVAQAQAHPGAGSRSISEGQGQESSSSHGGDSMQDHSDSSSSSDSDGSNDSSSAEGKAGGSSSSPSSSGNEDEGGLDDAPSRERGGVNNMLLSMYARTPQAETDDNRAGPGPSSTAAAARAPLLAREAGRKRGRSPPAFASPEAVAAAASRALAAKKGKPDTSQQQQQPPTITAAPIAGAAQPSSSSRPLPASKQQTGDMPARNPASDGDHPGVVPDAAQAAGQPAAEGATASGAATPAPPGGTDRVGQPSAAKRGRRPATGGTGGAAGGAGGRQRPFASGGGGGTAVVAARAVTYADLGGVEEVLSDIRELIEYPLKHPEVYAWLGVEPPRGVLLHGPPGCGKTALANAIANECGVPFLRVSAPEIVSGMSGESEAKLRSLFQEAADLAPCIVFIDEIDAIAPKRETAQREMERRIVAQMLTCMDDLSSPVPGAEPGKQETDENGQRSSGASNPDAGSAPASAARPHVVVIGATNRPDALDPALRRAGRFDREITLGIPTEAARCKILQVISRRLRLEGHFDFTRVAKRTPGFVGADLMALVKEAAALAVTRIFDTLRRREVEDQQQRQQQQERQHLEQHVSAGAEGGRQAMAVDGPLAPTPSTITAGVDGATMQDAILAAAAVSAAAGQDAPSKTEAPVAARNGGGSGLAADDRYTRFGAGPLGPAELSGLAISMGDFETAVSKVQPSVRREGFTTTPDVTWEDVGSLDEVREELSFSITQPVLHPERFEAMGMAMATGVLLYGPPGCGKTLVAKAVAHESGANFISIKGPELLNKYVGESERAVRQLFARARAAQPCVLFFDELDALAPRRGTDTNQAAERVVNQLLTEMDGVEQRQGVYVVAATNRPDMVDPALLRPGRLGKVLYVPLPPPDGRAAILRALVRRTPLAPDVDIAAVGASERCNGFSGADMAALVREASVLALKEAIATADSANTKHDSGSGSGKGRAGAGVEMVRVGARHFDNALARMAPSVSRKDARTYEALRKSLRGNLRSRLEGGDEGVAPAGAALLGHPLQPPAAGVGAADAAGPGADAPAGSDGRPPMDMAT